jgi:hypothetical protein
LFKSGSANNIVYVDYTTSAISSGVTDSSVTSDSLANIMKNNTIILIENYNLNFVENPNDSL